MKHENKTKTEIINIVKLIKFLFKKNTVGMQKKDKEIRLKAKRPTKFNNCNNSI